MNEFAIMNEFVREKTDDLQRKLRCKRWLAVLLAFLISIVAAPVLLIIWWACLVVMFVCGAACCAVMPFCVLYNCVKEWKR